MPLSDDQKQIVAEWARHPGMALARAWLVEKKNADQAALGAELFADPGSYDPIKIARRAGDYADALTALTHLLGIAKSEERRAKQATDKETSA